MYFIDLNCYINFMIFFKNISVCTMYNDEKSIYKITFEKHYKTCTKV